MSFCAWLLVVLWRAAFGEPPSEQLARAAHAYEALLYDKTATHLEATLRHLDATLPGHLSPKIPQFFDWVKADLGAAVMALALGSRPPEDTLGIAVLPEGPRTCRPSSVAGRPSTSALTSSRAVRCSTSSSLAACRFRATTTRR